MQRKKRPRVLGTTVARGGSPTTAGGGIMRPSGLEEVRTFEAEAAEVVVNAPPQ